MPDPFAAYDAFQCLNDLNTCHMASKWHWVSASWSQSKKVIMKRMPWTLPPEGITQPVVSLRWISPRADQWTTGFNTRPPINTEPDLRGSL